MEQLSQTIILVTGSAIYKVPRQTLDSFEIGNIGFIKIDVEGH